MGRLQESRRVSASRGPPWAEPCARCHVCAPALLSCRSPHSAGQPGAQHGTSGGPSTQPPFSPVLQSTICSRSPPRLRTAAPAGTRQQPQCPSSQLRRLRAPAQSTGRMETPRDTQGEGLCPQWDPLSCSPGVWNTEESSGEQKQPKKMRPLGSEMAQMFLDHRTAPAPHVTTWRCSGWGGPTSAGTAHSPTPPLLPHAVSSASFCSPVPHSCTPPRATPGFVHEVTALSPMFECCLWLRSAWTSVPEAQISLTESGGCTWRPGHEENGG